MKCPQTFRMEPINLSANVRLPVSHSTSFDPPTFNLLQSTTLVNKDCYVETSVPRVTLKE